MGAAPEDADASAPTAAPPPVFPPEDITPPHERSRQPDDGRWVLLGSAETGDRAATEPRVLARTALHPHPTSRFITVTVVAIDLGRTRIGFVPGADDPRPKDATFTAGLVPESVGSAAIAVFNGGFQPKHGWWGMRLGESELVRPRPDGCTVAIDGEGRVRVAMWEDVAPGADSLAAYRQTPPCLVTGGELSSRLTSGNDRIFGGKAEDHTTRRRSGIGVSEDGTVLFFAIGEEGDARHLAEGLRLAGAHAAAQLDINWNWTRFLLVGDTESGARITATLLPNMNHGRREYVERPSQRDFFYVARR